MLLELEQMKTIQVLEYSPKQKCHHVHSLYKHIEVNKQYPKNEYFIIDGFQKIPKRVLEATVFNKYIRIGTLDSVNSVINREGNIERFIEKSKHYKIEHDKKEEFINKLHKLEDKLDYTDDPDRIYAQIEKLKLIEWVLEDNNE